MPPVYSHILKTLRLAPYTLSQPQPPTPCLYPILIITPEGLKGGVPPEAGRTGGTAQGPGGASFRYSGVDPETAQHIFESLFGGGLGGMGGMFGGMGGMGGMGGGMAGGMGGGTGPRRRVHVFSSGPRGASSMFGPSPGTPPSPGVMFGDENSDDDNPFGGFGSFQSGFGGGGPMGRGAGAGAPAGPEAQQVPLKVSLEDLYKGTTKVRGGGWLGRGAGG